jgi:hypothetical protein
VAKGPRRRGTTLAAALPRSRAIYTLRFSARQRILYYLTYNLSALGIVGSAFSFETDAIQLKSFFCHDDA